MSTGLSVEEKKKAKKKKKKKKKKRKDFQDGGHGGHLGIGTILAILIFKSPQCFLLSFKSIGLSVQGKKRKIDFQDGRHILDFR